MGMGHDPVVEMGYPLHIREGHHGALNADEEIHNGAGKHKLGADIGMDFPQFSVGRVPDVDQKCHDRYDHGHAVDDGDDLEPGGHRHLKKMVGSDMGIDHQQRPESEQREGVAVKGRPASPGDHIIGHADGQRRQKQGRKHCGRKTREEWHPECPPESRCGAAR